MRLIAIIVLFLFPLSAQAEVREMTSPEKEEIVQYNVESCILIRLRRGDESNAAYPFCNCMGQVLSDNFTPADFQALKKATTEELISGKVPQFQRIQPQLQACMERKSSPRELISFISFDPAASQIKVPVRLCGLRHSAAVVLARKNDRRDSPMWSAAVLRGSEEAVPLKGFEWPYLEEIGTINLDGKGNIQVFVVQAESGADYSTTILNLINVDTSDVVGMTIRNNKRESSPSDVGTTENFDDPKFRREKDFLNKIRNEYGYAATAMEGQQKIRPDRERQQQDCRTTNTCPDWMKKYLQAEQLGEVDSSRSRLRCLP